MYKRQDPTTVVPVVPDPTTVVPVVPDPTTVVPVVPDPATIVPVVPDPATVRGAVTSQITEPVAAPILEPVFPVTTAQAVPVVNVDRGASYSASALDPQVVKTEGPLESHPPLFDTSLLLGGQLVAFAAEAATAVNELPGGIPNPLLPFGFPSSTPPVGSTFRGGSGMEIGLDLLAVLALLLVLSRTGGSSVSPREGFKLISSPRLVTELPG